MEKYYGSWGWAEFDSNRYDIIAKYESAKAKDTSRPVKTQHGNCFEAALICWLNQYLPKKYEATSGYIVPNNFETSGKILHYDVIIFLRNESPVLWIDIEGQDAKSKAIPARYIVAIFEVKSTFTHSNIKDAITKLEELNRYSFDFNQSFFSGLIFAELLEKDIKKVKMIEDLYGIKNIYKFWAGVILKNSIEDDISCFFTLTNQTNVTKELPDEIVKDISKLNIYTTSQSQIKIDGKGSSIQMTKIADTKWAVLKEYGIIYGENNVALEFFWSREQFLNFSIELLNQLSNTHNSESEKPKYGRIFEVLEMKDV